MAEDLVNFLFDPPPDKNVFTVSGKAVYDPNNPVPGTPIFNIRTSQMTGSTSSAKATIRSPNVCSQQEN